MLVSEDLSRMTISADAPSLVETELVGPRPSAGAATARRASSGKKSAAESWADWRATGTPASADVFYESVSSWIDGVSAQLVRPLWPAGGVRPTSAEARVRLRRALTLVLAEEPEYVKALEAARRHVAHDLSKQRARDLAAS